MKIVCDSCSAKYSIADEKVAGRVFKIRCKKCGAAIVVRGDQVNVGGAEAEEAPVADYGSDAVWHVVVDGDQQGPFAPAQLGEMLSAGTIGWDAFVWREGFDDWKPAQDIEELVQAIMGGSEPQADAAPADADPFAATQHGASADPSGFGAPAAVAPRADDAGADLFAQTDSASPFDGGSDEEDDVVASAPSPRVSAEQALTGARNENSVLFSLSNLQALATGPGGGSTSSSSSSSSAAPKPGMAHGEGSGLIDIRALASATGLTPGSSGPVTSASDDKVDDLLSIGSAGGLGSPLGAPVLIPEKKEEKSKGPLYFGIAAAAVVVLGLGAMVFLGGGDGDEPPVAAAGAVAPGEAVAAAGTAQPAEPAQPTEAAPAPAAEATTPEPTPQAPAAAASAEEEKADEQPQRQERTASAGSSRRDRPRRGGSASSAPAQAAASSGSSGSSRRGGSRGSSDNIDDLLADAIGGGGRGARSQPTKRGGSGGGGGGGASSGPQTPSRSDIMSAMSGVQGAVRACGSGGTAVVRVSFAGSTGRVTNARVNSSLPGPVKSCIATAVRRARVPPFQQANFSVNYPFNL